MSEQTENPWALYDALLEGVPAGIEVIDFCVGRSWSYVEAACGMGVARTVSGGTPRRLDADPRDTDLRGLASLVKSWNFVEATLGVAALNAWYASPGKVAALGGSIGLDGAASRDAENPLRAGSGAYAGRRVVVVGHFPGVEALAREAEVTVLERDCASPADVPDPACEYLVPGADFLFMTGTALTNKTAPRLLRLGERARTTLVGPSAVPCPALFGFGADAIAGSVVADPGPAKFAVRGGSKADWRAGIKKFLLRRA